MNKGLIAGIVVGGVAVAGAATGLGVGLANNTAEYQVNIVSELESAEFEGNGTYQIGDQVELSAQDVEGYRFVYWSLPNGEISRENPYKFTLTNANYGTYTAVYEKEYTITVGEFLNGEITSDRPVAITGEEVTLTVTPDENYHVSNISYTTSSGTTTIEYSNGYKFLMPAEDVEITATFAQSAFNITKASMTNGDITLSNTSGVNGTEITVSAQPETGYELDQLYYIAQGSTTHVAITDNTFTLTSNVTVYATFKQIEYTISQIPTQVSIKKNNVALSSTDTLHYGDEITISYAETEGFEKTIFNVVGAIHVEGDIYTVTGNLTITYEEDVVYDASIYTALSFTFYKETKTASVARNSSKSLTGELTIPKVVKYDDEIYFVTEIEEYAFSFTDLTSITIPNSIVIIGDFAFSETKISSIVIPDSVVTIGDWVFDCCGDLENVTLSRNLEHIGFGCFNNCSKLNYKVYEHGKYLACPSNDYFMMIGVEDNSLETYIINPNTKILYEAFSGCTNLSTITIPRSVKAVKYNVFFKCISLTEIKVDENNTEYKSVQGVLFSKDGQTIVAYPAGKVGNYVIPSTVTSIGASAFSYCTNFTAITIPSNVTSIEYNTFAFCSNLTTVEFESESKLKRINDYAFQNCSSLTSIKIPSNVTRIGRAFERCTGLISINIPSSVTIIGDLAFSECTSLTIVTFEKGSQLTSIGHGAFRYCESLATVTFGEESQLAVMGEQVFYRCASLTTITIPALVTSMGREVFAYCSNLSTLIFEEGSKLTNIAVYSFLFCSKLVSINIPSGVTSIGNWAFECCFNLTTVIIDSSYAYRTATSSSDFGNLLQNATTVKVLKSIVDDETNTNNYLNSTAWTKAAETETIDGQEYYVYTKN